MRVSPPRDRSQVFTASPLTLHTKDNPGLGGASQDLPRLFPAELEGKGLRGWIACIPQLSISGPHARLLQAASQFRLPILKPVTQPVLNPSESTIQPASPSASQPILKPASQSVRPTGPFPAFNFLQKKVRQSFYISFFFMTCRFVCFPFRHYCSLFSRRVMARECGWSYEEPLGFNHRQVSTSPLLNTRPRYTANTFFFPFRVTYRGASGGVYCYCCRIKGEDLHEEVLQQRPVGVGLRGGYCRMGS
ncbi:hypothetical protein E2C01_000280 [Portunus trituberculatus]|uniref:Uncharacterized protein n=1 Tax=Portunus trituberculatus TaxID=210409 RepID=A0A5B7CG82_PORTR|nr:hypothetical protein [Portunus trituberculatus]